MTADRIRQLMERYADLKSLPLWRGLAPAVGYLCADFPASYHAHPFGKLTRIEGEMVGELYCERCDARIVWAPRLEHLAVILGVPAEDVESYLEELAIGRVEAEITGGDVPAVPPPMFELGNILQVDEDT